MKKINILFVLFFIFIVGEIFVFSFDVEAMKKSLPKQSPVPSFSNLTGSMYIPIYNEDIFSFWRVRNFKNGYISEVQLEIKEDPKMIKLSPALIKCLVFIFVSKDFKVEHVLFKVWPGCEKWTLDDVKL